MKTTKSQKVIDYLEKGNSLSKRECVEVFYYWNLSDLIYKLRKYHGQDYVLTEMKTTSTESEYADYSINPKYL